MFVRLSSRRTRSVRAARLGQQVVRRGTGHREFGTLHHFKRGGLSDASSSGYVALAVAVDGKVYSREVETGLGTDREQNMVAFAVEALKLVKDVIQGDAKL